MNLLLLSESSGQPSLGKKTLKLSQVLAEGERERDCFMPNVSPCGFVRDLGKKSIFSYVSDEAARRNVRQKKTYFNDKKVNSVGQRESGMG